MNKQIFYFSGTGNSLYVAKKIRETLGDTELIQITSELCQSKVDIEAETLGLVFPVYAYGPPVIVETFLKQAHIKQPEYFFVVATYGGNPRDALKYCERQIKQKGLTVDAGFMVAMPNNYITGFDTSSGEQLQKILVRANTELSEILLRITKQENVSIRTDSIADRIISMMVHPLFAFGRNKLVKKFYVSDTCTGCGICTKLCSVKNIVLTSAKRPQWGQHCEFCLACINWCPARAIEFGNKTQQRNRYHHPDIKVVELTRQ
jgi:ferredoxin/flavodoxin